MEWTTPVRSLAEPSDAQRYWLICKRRWLPATGVLAATLIGTAVFTLLQRPVYEAEGMMVFRRTSSTTALTGVGEKQGALEPLTDQGSPLETEAEIIRSQPVVSSVIEALALKDDEGRPLKRKAFLQKLSIKNFPKTDLLKITYQSHSAQEATAVINALMNAYLKENVFFNRAEAVAARRFVEARLPETEREVQRLEAAVRNFRERHRIVNLDEEAKVAVKLSADIDSELARARAERQDANAQAAAFRQQMGISAREALLASTLGQTPGVQKALEEYQQVQGQLAVQSTRYRGDHPTIQNLKARLAALEKLLGNRIRQVSGRTAGRPQFGTLREKLTEEFVRTEIRLLGQNSRYSALASARQTLAERLKELPRLDERERELNRRLKATQATYEDLLRKLQEIRLAENQKIGNARIVPASLLEDLAAPRPLVNLLAGGALGLLLAVATALILERRDRTIKTVQEVKLALPGTPLVVIPAFRPRQEPLAFLPEDPATGLVVHHYPDHPLSELFRILDVNLRARNRQAQPKLIVVTSSVAGEGKSTIAANLAAAAAQVGRRTLLIDADLRQPSQHRLWRLANGVGLSDLLSGEIAPQAHVRKVADSLDLLCAGTVREQPAALLASERAADLLADFASRYDLTIIDAPPLTITADAAILGRLADGVLMVVRPGVADVASVTAAGEIVAQAGMTCLGLAVNAVNPGNEPNSEYYVRRYGARPPTSGAAIQIRQVRSPR